MPTPPLEDVLVLVTRAVEDVLTSRDSPPSPLLGESTVLVGTPEAVLDSLGLILLLVQIETRIQERFRKTVVLAGSDLVTDGERSIETVGSLARYVICLLDGEKLLGHATEDAR